MLWATLLIPPLLAGLGAPLLLFGNIVLVAITIIVCLFVFLAVMQVRYRGNSLTFLGFAYFIGQSMICLVVGLGSCALMLRGSGGFR
jgi:hypothetical protein